MGNRFAVTWDDGKRKLLAFVAAAGIGAGALAGQGATLFTIRLTSIVVMAPDRQTMMRAEQALPELGGVVVRDLGIIHGFSARIPPARLPELENVPGIQVSPDGPISVEGAAYQPIDDGYSMFNLNTLIGATGAQIAGYDGRGIDVALVDTGVTPVLGLDTPGKIVNGPDISFDSQAGGLSHLDSFGHGTFIAGIIAGRDPTWTVGNSQAYAGVAPYARIVNVKVGATNGAADVSQVIAAIDWVVQHRHDRGLNIRVLNLSLGFDGSQAYTADPLAFAAEQAWRAGVVVVAAAGNDGTRDSHLLSPARDPYVISVGADDTHGTWNPAYHTIPAFSQNTAYPPTLVAPGSHMQGLRVPGSYIDDTYGKSDFGGRFLRGSGTSEATAYVSGAAADILSARPDLTPDQVKAVLVGTAQKLPNASADLQGAGLVNVYPATVSTQLGTAQNWTASAGDGSLQMARGGSYVKLGGVPLTGETDIFGHSFVSSKIASAEAAGVTWSGGGFNGATWAGSGWARGTWRSTPWRGVTWSGKAWTGVTWSGVTWSNCGWTGVTWSGNGWTGGTWSGGTWSGGTWSNDAWLTDGWN